MNARPRREGAARSGGEAPEPVLVGAVDVGATKTLVTVRTLPVATWEPGRALRLLTAQDPEAALDAIAAALVRLSGGRQLGAVGVGAPGPLDPASGVIAHSPNLGWREIPFGPTLAARLGVPVILDDDARSGALGEAILGAGSGADPVAYLTLSTGIGSGIVVGGELLRGAHGIAGEIGHLVIDPAGPPCGCGRRGCVESFAGGASLARRARVAWPDGRLADGRPAPLDAAGVLRLARAGDARRAGARERGRAGPGAGARGAGRRPGPGADSRRRVARPRPAGAGATGDGALAAAGDPRSGQGAGGGPGRPSR